MPVNILYKPLKTIRKLNFVIRKNILKNVEMLTLI